MVVESPWLHRSVITEVASVAKWSMFDILETIFSQDLTNQMAVYGILTENTSSSVGIYLQL